MKYRERVLGLILVSPLCKAPSWTEWLCNKVPYLSTVFCYLCTKRIWINTLDNYSGTVQVMSNLLYYYGMCGVLKECLLYRYFSKVLKKSSSIISQFSLPTHSGNLWDLLFFFY